MPQIFDRSSNALARMSLVLTGLIVIALGVTLDQLQRSPWVTRQGQRADQPVAVVDEGVDQARPRRAVLLQRMHARPRGGGECGLRAGEKS